MNTMNNEMSYFNMSIKEKQAFTRAVKTFTDPVKFAQIIDSMPMYQYQIAARSGIDGMVVSLLKTQPMKSLPREVLLRMYNLYTGLRYTWVDFCEANGTPSWGVDFPVERDQQAWRIETAMSQHLFRQGKAVARSFLSKFNGKSVPYGVRTPDVSYTLSEKSATKRINVRIIPTDIMSVPVGQRNELILEAFNEVQALILVDAKERKLLAGEPYIFAFGDKSLYKMVCDQFDGISTSNFVSFAFVDTQKGEVSQETPLLQNNQEVKGVFTHKKRVW